MTQVHFQLLRRATITFLPTLTAKSRYWHSKYLIAFFWSRIVGKGQNASHFPPLQRSTRHDLLCVFRDAKRSRTYPKSAPVQSHDTTVMDSMLFEGFFFYTLTETVCKKQVVSRSTAFPRSMCQVWIRIKCNRS